MTDRPAIIAEGLTKAFGSTKALDGLDLEAERGTVLGVLGPNGAGKTTAVRILTTLLQPDGGRAEVMGLDVVRDANELRSHIGLTGQYAAVDEFLTGRENLDMVGRLSRLSKADAKRRADELLEIFELTDAADRQVKTYSGGMRRKLDLGASLVAFPSVVFLDEPTTGLDPRARLAMWNMIRDLVARGTTLLLTTQYLEEADQLTDRVAVIDSGKVIAEGTSEALKRQVGGDRIEVTVGLDTTVEVAAKVLGELSNEAPYLDEESRMLSIPTTEGAKLLMEAVRRLDAGGVHVDDIHLRRPTLDDVFMKLTGRAVADRGEETPVPEVKR